MSFLLTWIIGVESSEEGFATTVNSVSQSCFNVKLDLDRDSPSSYATTLMRFSLYPQLAVTTMESGLDVSKSTVLCPVVSPVK